MNHGGKEGKGGERGKKRGKYPKNSYGVGGQGAGGNVQVTCTMSSGPMVSQRVEGVDPLGGPLGVVMDLCLPLGIVMDPPPNPSCMG